MMNTIHAGKCQTPHPEKPLRAHGGLAVFGLVLGLAGFLTCGLTAMAGVIVSTIGLYKGGKRSIAGIGLAVSVLGLLLAAPICGLHPNVVKRWRVNWRMYFRGLPSLPISAHNITSYSWRFFAADFMLVRFDAPAEDVNAFFLDLGATPGRRIGPGVGEVYLVTREDLRQLREESMSSANGQGYSFRGEHYETISGQYYKTQRWFCPQRIRKGSFFVGPVRSGAPGLGFQVYHDEDTNTVFLVWIGS